MLLWQCRTMKSSSELPWSEVQVMDDFLPVLVHNEPGEDLRSESALARSRWFNMVEDYSTRFTTWESYKLPALLGLKAKFSMDIGSSEYSSGIFQAHMPSALMWRVKPRRPEEQTTVFNAFQPRRPIKWRAPSWSWAAIDGATTYDSQRLTGNVTISSTQSPTQSDFGMTYETGLRSPFCVAEHLGFTQNAALFVNGRVLSLRSERIAEQCKVPLAGGIIYLVNTNDEIAGAFFPDIPLDCGSINTIICLEVCREPYYSSEQLPARLQVSASQLGSQDEFDKHPMVMGLGLTSDTEGEGVYRRIGLVRWVARSRFDGVSVVKLCLV